MNVPTEAYEDEYTATFGQRMNLKRITGGGVQRLILASFESYEDGLYLLVLLNYGEKLIYQLKHHTTKALHGNETERDEQRTAERIE